MKSWSDGSCQTYPYSLGDSVPQWKLFGRKHEILLPLFPFRDMATHGLVLDLDPRNSVSHIHFTWKSNYMYLCLPDVAYGNEKTGQKQF